MKNFKWIFAVCLFVGYFNRGFCRAVQEETAAEVDNEYLGDDYDYDDDYDLPKSNESISYLPVEKHIVTLDPPYFEQPELEMHAMPGDDVVLNCDARNFRINNVVIWYKEGAVIANGQTAIDNRVEGMKNNSIRIRNVQTDDAGDYYCEVLPEKVRLHATLNIGGRLAIFCDGREVTDRSLIFRQGETHVFECRTYIPGDPIIKWSLNGQRAENVVTKVDGSKMYIDNIDAENSGIYQCLGDDDSQDPAHGMVTIDVHYSPKVSTHRHHVNTATGATAELYCDYKANPIAVTRWLKSDKVLSYSQKYLITNMEHKNRNRTLLTVKDVNAADLGEYICQVENTIGANEVKVHLQYEPETPQFEEMVIDGNKVTLHWLVRSLQPLSEAVLDYKMLGAYTWSTVSVIHTQRHAEQSGIWKVIHEMELMPGEWHTRVKTRNTVGWSKFSAQHDFTIKDPDDDAVTVGDEIPPEDMVMAAGIGFGGGGDSGKGGASAQTNAVSSVIVMALLSLALLAKTQVPSTLMNL